MTITTCPPVLNPRLAWKKNDWSPSDYTVDLSPAAVEEIREFMKTEGDKYDHRTCGADSFHDKTIALLACRSEIEEIESRFLKSGPGFVVINALSPDDFSLAQLKVVMACVCGNFGNGLVAQDTHGEVVKEVADRGLPFDPASSKYSDSNRGGNYHTDGTELPIPIRYFPLYCVRPAARGGVSKLVSSYTIHNRLQDDDLNSLQRLYRPFYWDRRSRVGPNGERTIEKPVFEYDKDLKCRYQRLFIELGYKLANQSVEQDVSRALDAMDRHLYDDALAMDIPLRAGQVLVCNNSFTLHGRSEFQDAPGQPRLYLRGWVADTIAA